MNIVLFFSFLSGRTLQMNFPYVMSLLQLFGMFFLLINVIVLVEFFMRLPNPFSRRPSSFADDVLQFFCILDFLLVVCN